MKTKNFLLSVNFIFIIRNYGQFNRVLTNTIFIIGGEERELWMCNLQAFSFWSQKLFQYWVVSMSRNLFYFNNHPCCRWLVRPSLIPQHFVLFLVNTGLAETTVWFPSLILRCIIHRSSGLDWLRSTDRGLDHSLGKLEPSDDSVVFSGWLADRVLSLDVRIQRERPVWQNHRGW